MPRGFLVKRSKKAYSTGSGYSWRKRQGSECEERASSDSERSVSGGSEHGDSIPALSGPCVGSLYSSSPDSGYSGHSPVSSTHSSSNNENLAPLREPPPLTTTPSLQGSISRELSPASQVSTPASSPLTNPASLPSPHGFQFSAFDRLSVCSPHQGVRIGGPLFPGHLLPPHHNGNYLPPPPMCGPGGPATTSSLLLQAAPGGILSAVNTAPLHPPPTNYSPGKKRPSSDIDPPSVPRHQSQQPTVKTPKSSAKKPKAARKIHFDEDKSSPVSGTIIRDAGDTEDRYKVTSGDIDSSLNLVEVTAEARAELQKIDNKIGDYICQLCRDRYEDAFQLAQHKCSRIIHVEYRCPECDKVFNCPANLASHRRWHKPRPNATGSATSKGTKGNQPNSNSSKAMDTLNGNYLPVNAPRDMFREGEEGKSPPGSPTGSQDGEGQYECQHCRRRFKREAYLRKHEATHQVPPLTATHKAPLPPPPIAHPVIPQTTHQMSPPQTIHQVEPASTDGPVTCHYCGKGMKNEASRTKHILQTHTPGLGGQHSPLNPTNRPRSPQPALMCPVCQQPFPSQAALERHQRLHATDMFSCKYCASVFYSSPGLTRHINKCHPSENRQVILLQLPQANRTC